MKIFGTIRFDIFRKHDKVNDDQNVRRSVRICPETKTIFTLASFFLFSSHSLSLIMQFLARREEN